MSTIEKGKSRPPFTPPLPFPHHFRRLFGLSRSRISVLDEHIFTTLTLSLFPAPSESFMIEPRDGNNI